MSFRFSPSSITLILGSVPDGLTRTLPLPAILLSTFSTTCWISGKVTGISITLTIGLAGLTAVSIETGGVFGYDKVPQRVGRRSMNSNGKCQVMLSEPNLSEASALIEVDEIPNHQANKPFSPSLPRNTAKGKTYLNERKGSC